MKTKKITALILALIMLLSLCACGSQNTAPTATETPAADTPAESEVPAAEPEEITITDMIGREVTVTPGSYKRVVCIGAGALRMYSYIGDVSLLCGVEDIDNTTLDERPKMFDSVARPYVLAFGDTFSTLPSCGVGGPNAQAAEAAPAVLRFGKTRSDERTHEWEKDGIDKRELIEIEHIAVFQGEAPALPGIAAVERPRAGRGGQGKRCQENITAAVFEIFGFQQCGHRLRSFPVMSRKISSSVFPSSISCRRSSSP